MGKWKDLPGDLKWQVLMRLDIVSLTQMRQVNRETRSIVCSQAFKQLLKDAHSTKKIHKWLLIPSSNGANLISTHDGSTRRLRFPHRDVLIGGSGEGLLLLLAKKSPRSRERDWELRVYNPATAQMRTLPNPVKEGRPLDLKHFVQTRNYSKCKCGIWSRIRLRRRRKNKDEENEEGYQVFLTLLSLHNETRIPHYTYDSVSNGWDTFLEHEIWFNELRRCYIDCVDDIYWVCYHNCNGRRLRICKYNRQAEAYDVGSESKCEMPGRLDRIHCVGVCYDEEDELLWVCHSFHPRGRIESI